MRPCVNPVASLPANAPHVAACRASTPVERHGFCSHGPILEPHPRRNRPPATDAAGAAQGVRREVETVVSGQIERLIKEMDVATREEVEVLRDMVVAAREENEQLALRLKALEERLAALEGYRRGGRSRRPLDLGRP